MTHLESANSMGIFLRGLEALHEIDFCNPSGAWLNLKHNTPGMMPLNIETTYVSDKHVFIDLSHTYEQNGDLMRDPEVTLMVVKWVEHGPETKTYNQYKYKAVYPIAYIQDNMGIRHEYVVFKDGVPVFVRRYGQMTQKSLASFVRQWKKNLVEQGYYSNATVANCEKAAW